MEKITILLDTLTNIINDIQSKPIELAKYQYTHGFNGYRYDAKKKYIFENDEKIVVSANAYKIRFSKTTHFVKLTNRNALIYNKITKKLSFNKNNGMRERLGLFHHLAEYLHIDWYLKLSTYEKYKKIPLSNIMTKTLGEHILNGKVNNPEQLFKDYILISYKRKDIPWKLVRDYFNCQNRMSYYTYNITLYNIFTYATNPISALNIFVNQDKGGDYCSLINDMLEQCFILNKKINFAWSNKRLMLEHELMTNKIMEFEIGTKNTESIQYEGELPLLNGMEILDSEYKVFVEANYMHNCLYSNYWSRIENKLYFVIKYVKNGVHYDIGIYAQYSRDKVGIDQIKCQYNKEPSTEIVNEIEEWFNQPQVQDFFVSQKNETIAANIYSQGGLMPF